MTALRDASYQLCRIFFRSVMRAYAEAKLAEFATAHADEEFYCLCVYFDGHYADFLLYLNDRQKARETATHLKDSFPSLHGHQSVEEVEADSKWNCGDFRYSFFNVDNLWETLWRPIQREYERLGMELYHHAPKTEQELWDELMSETACLVALDLEAGQAIKILKKTDDFRVICVDHDETMRDSTERLARVRKNYSPLS